MTKAVQTMDTQSLSETEQVAKDYVINLIINGLQSSQPCDSSFCDDDFKLPEWYDESKYKRGQKYYFDNRSGIMLSNLYGLFSLICEPMGAKLLDRTGMSSTPATAKKRYISTTIHMMSWYQIDLTPGSDSWESLKRVRKMHLQASRTAEKHGFGNIPQAAMAMTKFGFMGYALIKPHMLGIRHDNVEDREAFVHLWAVLGFMLGIKDEFNMCLHPLEVVETICRIFLRYAFLPFLQLETPTFKKLGKAFIEGMGFFIPFSSYESRLFLARRLAGIPGYQYDTDMSKEGFQRQIFSPDEVKKLVEQFQSTPGHEYRRHMVFDEKMYLLDIKRIDDLKSEDSEAMLDSLDENSNIFGHYTSIGDSNNNSSDEKWGEDIKFVMDFLDLKDPSELLITEVDESNINMYLNDRKFKKLSFRDQHMVRGSIHHVRMLENRFTRPFYEAGLSTLMFFMERYYRNQK